MLDTPGELWVVGILTTDIEKIFVRKGKTDIISDLEVAFAFVALAALNLNFSAFRVVLQNEI